MAYLGDYFMRTYSDHNGLKLEINNRRTTGKSPNI